MGDKIEVNYEELGNIQKLFNSEAESINQLNQQTRQKVAALIGAGQSANWVGRGSEAFAAEMEGQMLPSLGRLVKALQDASQATQRIIQTYQGAEEEAKTIFTAP